MKKTITMSVIALLAIVFIGPAVPAHSQDPDFRCPNFDAMMIVDTCTVPQSCNVIDSGEGPLGQLVALQCISTQTTADQPLQFTFIAQRSPRGSFTFEYTDRETRVHISLSEVQAQDCIEEIIDASEELGCD